MKTVAERILFIIDDKKVKRSDFAKAANVSPAYISMLAKDHTINPSHNFLRTVSDVYGVNIAWLMTGEGEIYRSISHEDEIAEIAAALFENRDDDFRIRLVKALAKVDSSQLKLVEEFVKGILKDEKRGEDDEVS